MLGLSLAHIGMMETKMETTNPDYLGLPCFISAKAERRGPLSQPLPPGPEDEDCQRTPQKDL